MDGQGLQRRKDSEVHLRENCASCLMSGGVRCRTLARSLHVPPPHFTFMRLLHFTFTPIASSNVYAHCKARISPAFGPRVDFGFTLLAIYILGFVKTSSLTVYTVASQASSDHEDQEALLGAKSPATVPRMKEGFSQAPPILR